MSMDGAMLIWIALLAVRVLWAALRQTGYIHPDEFFQSVEVVAGDVFNITVQRTWEFTSDSPLRSMVLPQLLFRPVFLLLQTVPAFLLTARLVLISQRCLMVCLSLIIDWSVFRISKILQLKCQRTSLLVSGSYVMMTYQLHSFSNSFETVLSILLVWCLIEDIKGKIGSSSEVETVKEGDSEKSPTKTVGNAIEDSQKYEKYSKEDCQKDGEAVHKIVIQGLHTASYNLRKRQFKVKPDSFLQGCQNADTVTYTENRDTNDGKVRTSKTENGDVNDLYSNETRSDPYRQENIDGNYESLAKNNSKTDLTFLSSFIVAVVALINIAGIFNRPTFVAFSIVPFLWWVSCFPSKKVAALKLTIFLTFSVISTISFVVLDSCYFNKIPISSIFNEDINITQIIDKMVFTPLNFIVYNMNVKNLAKHGRHPFYLHFLVNLPLLFGPLAYFVFRNTFKQAFNIITGKFTLSRKSSVPTLGKNSSDSKLRIPWLGFILAPIAILSIFPHQEPRFLIPLLPLIIIFAASQLSSSHHFASTFLIYNLLMSILYGCLHQGGMLPCMFRLSELSQNLTRNENVKTIFMFSHTYMPPQHLLLSNNPHVKVMDFQGSDLGDVVNDITHMKSPRACDGGTDNAGCKNITSKLYLSLPGTLMNDLHLRMKGSGGVNVIDQFYPHLSLEEPPGRQCVVDMSSFKNCLSLYLVEVL